MEICAKEECTACMACGQICPKGAISLQKDKSGNVYPAIDSNMCVDCGLCRKVCPSINAVTTNFPMKAFAAWTKNDADRRVCSSGGIATGLARKFVSEGNFAYGVGQYRNKKFEISRASSLEEIEKFIGSKYVQCYTGSSYKSVKEDLKSGKKVLYIGTPCQIAGLNSFLGTFNDNLYTVDLICHGVPSVEYLNNHLDTQTKSNCITDITFRGKEDFILCAYEKDRQIYRQECNLDSYFCSFLQSVTYRENCYSCKYAKHERCSDLTIGDYWGIDREALEEPYDGRISVILVNTKKGMKLLEESDEIFHMEEKPAEDAFKYNDQLNHPSVRTKDADTFVSEYSINGDFDKAIKKTELYRKVILKRIIKRRIKTIIKGIIKK